MVRIPISSDVAALVGDWGEKVENRSLLLEKFSFHKRWPREEDDKWDDAARWSFVRVANDGKDLLNKEADAKQRRSDGRNTQRHNQERLRQEAKIAKALAKVSWNNPEMATLRANHTRRFLGLFNSTCANQSCTLIAKLEGRLAINISDSLIRNAGIALDRLFGLPYIPGSAIKGVTRATALQEVAASSKDERLFTVFQSVFGTADNDFRRGGELESFSDLLGCRPRNSRGAIAFLPAYPIDEPKIGVDLTNVHYPTYYQGDRKKHPGDITSLRNESPQPNHFPCVETGARFAFCLAQVRSDTSSDLLEAARRWLLQALTIHGLGAKTAAGYGWFSIEPPEVLEELQTGERNRRKASEDAAKREAEKIAADAAEKARITALSPEERLREMFIQLPDQDFAGSVLNLKERPLEEQRAILLLLCSDKRDRWKKWKKSDKANDKKRVEVALQTSKIVGIALP
jgi:CRISPR-associated protein Cmr6